ncbi:HNH/ENDO VII family nuclease [Lentibacillus jeotgali]|nr:HNH/ENDO VII family nuclease [Lentibacillus jeotgali]
MKKGRSPYWEDGTAIELHHKVQYFGIIWSRDGWNYKYQVDYSIDS